MIHNCLEFLPLTMISANGKMRLLLAYGGGGASRSQNRHFNLILRAWYLFKEVINNRL